MSYSPEMRRDSLLENLLFGNELGESAYAYFESEWNEVHLLPASLQLLKERRYEEVAQILSHERAHQSIVQSGMVIPSVELLHRSVEFFLGMQETTDPVDKLIQSALRNIFHLGIHATFLSMVPEEEAQAHTQEFIYALERLPRHKTQTLRKEALDGIHLLWGHAQEFFPPSWMLLSAQYFLMSQDLQRPPEESATGRGLSLLFREDLRDRVACSFQWEGNCKTASTAFRKLREIP